jgi:hypothetical protein
VNPPNKPEILNRILGMRTLCPEGKKEVTSLVEAIIGEPLTPPPPILDPKKTYLFVHRDGKGSAVVILPAGSKEAYSIHPETLAPMATTWSLRQAEQFIKSGLWLITATFGGEK